MPINTHGSGIQVITNVGGDLLDNDEFVAQRAHAEHTVQATSDLPWSQSYKADEVPFIEDTDPAQPDPALDAAHQKDLRNKLHIFPSH